jgi:hypothetical protein
MKILRRGSRDPEVAFLQRCLNRHFFRIDRSFRGLVEDADFGPDTEAALRRFQTAQVGRGPIRTADGVAGRDTWAALGLTVDISHDLPRVGQNTGMSCWVVSGGLASRRMASLPGGLARVGPDGGLRPQLGNIEVWGRQLGFRMLPMVPTQVDELVPHLRRAPVLLVVDLAGGGRHMVVVSGYFASTDRETRMIRINDPAPMGVGSIYLTEYPGLILAGGPASPYCLLVQ